MKWESKTVPLKDKPRQDEISLNRYYRNCIEFHLKLDIKASVELVGKLIHA